MTDVSDQNSSGGAIPFERLEVFQRAYRLSLEVHRTSLSFPDIEQRALADQIRRASKSICANLVEGFAKQAVSKAEWRRYCMMALGSADEMRLWSRYCLDLQYVDEAAWRHWRDEYQEIARMIQGLVRSAGRTDPVPLDARARSSDI